ncbi:MAG: putative quinol monooxygenase [Terriglobales bacterium]
MPDTVLSIAVMEPFEGCEEEFVAVLSDLYRLLERKGYSRDRLLRNRKDPPHYFNIRHWTSFETRQEAHEDPEVHRYWAKLGHLCKMVRVHEILDEVDWKAVEPLKDLATTWGDQ